LNKIGILKILFILSKNIRTNTFSDFARVVGRLCQTPDHWSVSQKRLTKFVSSASGDAGSGDTEGKTVKGSAEQGGSRASFNRFCFILSIVSGSPASSSVNEIRLTRGS